MTSEWFFRLFLATQIAIVLGIRKYYQRQSSNIKKQGVSQDNDTLILIAMPTILLAISVIVAMVYVIHPQWIRWSFLTLWPVLRWSGIILTITGVILLFWCHYTLGKNFFGGMKIRDGHTLVVSGPYHWVRHPMYTSFILLGTGFFLVTTSWMVGLPWLLGTFVVLWSRLGKEERMLFDEFGNSYEEYQKRTGRFFPQIWRS